MATKKDLAKQEEPSIQEIKRKSYLQYVESNDDVSDQIARILTSLYDGNRGADLGHLVGKNAGIDVERMAIELERVKAKNEQLKADLLAIDTQTADFIKRKQDEEAMNY